MHISLYRRWPKEIVLLVWYPSVTRGRSRRPYEYQGADTYVALCMLRKRVCSDSTAVELLTEGANSKAKLTILSQNWGDDLAASFVLSAGWAADVYMWSQEGSNID